MANGALQALIFDADGTLADSERAHLAAGIAPKPLAARHVFTGALKVAPDLSQVTLAQVRQWQNSNRG
jgi:phosphoglycolate phosphatase-like HAD superfamily hydrolase